MRIAQLTGLSTTTVTNLIGELLAAGVVAEDGFEEVNGPRGAGRPRTALRLEPESRYAVGVHIDVGSVHVAVTDLFARPLCIRTLEHSLDQSAEDVLAATADLVQETIRACDVDRARLVGAGVGASGLVDPHRGVNVLAPNLGWLDVPIRDWLAHRLKLPVFVDNNVRAMALGEALFGAGRDVYVLAFVYARIGVGAGFVVGGDLYRGGAGAGRSATSRSWRTVASRAAAGMSAASKPRLRAGHCAAGPADRRAGPAGHSGGAPRPGSQTRHQLHLRRRPRR